MRLLYHFPLSPEGRLVRLALAEKKLQFGAEAVDLNGLPPAVLTLSPRAQVPLLVDEDRTPVAGAGAITEYLEELYPLENLLGTHAAERAETRSLVDWLNTAMARDLTDKLYGEKLLKRAQRNGAPDSRAIRSGLDAIDAYLRWIGAQCDLRRWLAGDQLSLADLACAAQISVIDYLGDIHWQNFPSAKTWYGRIKSRPSFRPLLADSFPGLPPAAHYGNIDF
jgi:glutathione S-transferase